MFSMSWSIGASCNQEGRVMFDQLVRELMEVCALLCLSHFFLGKGGRLAKGIKNHILIFAYVSKIKTSFF